MAGYAVARGGGQRVSLDNAFHAGDFFVPPSAYGPLCDSIRAPILQIMQTFITKNVFRRFAPQ